MKRVFISVAILLLLSLPACTGAGDTQSSGGEVDYNAGYQVGHYSGFREGAEAGWYARGSILRVKGETFGDWFYDAYPQYRQIVSQFSKATFYDNGAL